MVHPMAENPGVLLRAQRDARGWSRAELARRLHEAADETTRRRLPATSSLTMMIKQWESGRHSPSSRYRVLCALAFGLPEHELFPAALPTLLSLSISRTPPPPSAPPVGPVALELVVYFLEQLTGHYRADMLLGPKHLIPTVTTQTQLIDDLIQASDGKVRRGLLGAGVAYSALLGWLHQDAGDIAQSARWRSVSLDMAHRSGDPQLISYTLTNKAMLGIDLGDGRAVVDYAEAALVDEQRLCPKALVLGLVHQAHGYSFLGLRSQVDTALDRAAHLVDQVDDEYPWGNACRRTNGYIDIQRATAYVRLGEYREAVGLWEQILGSATESARRDNAVFWTRQATALAALSEPERVVEIATATAAVAFDTGSVRLRRELVALREQATGWARTNAGRELNEIIAGIA